MPSAPDDMTGALFFYAPISELALFKFLWFCQFKGPSFLGSVPIHATYKEISA